MEVINVGGSSLVSSIAFPIFQNVLLIGSRGALAVLAASSLSQVVAESSTFSSISSFPSSRSFSVIHTVRGGGIGGGKQNVDTKKQPNNKKQADVKKTIDNKKGSKSKDIKKVDDKESELAVAKLKSTLLMACAMACHYLGYSLARPVTISLFTSAKTGYAGNSAAFPFAMAFISPMSLLLLVGYGQLLERAGPRAALSGSTIFCAGTLAIAALGILTSENLQLFNIPLVKYITGPLFIFRESYVQLLTSQYWSFMASALTPTQSAKYFGPIAGLTSITSAVAGFLVTDITKRIGLSGALLGTGIMLLLSLFPAGAAYTIAKQNGFCPSDSPHHNKKIAGKKGSQQDEDPKHVGLIEKATKLFARVPVLRALFIEILAAQGLATILNIAFVAKIGIDIPDDAERAGYVGKFFSTINVITMCLQFGLLPPLMAMLEPKQIWRAIPVLMLVFSSYQATLTSPSLYVVSCSLLVMKTLEYSVRRMLDEMVYVPLDFESRFLGKEVIGVFGYRFGKSLMSLALSGITAIVGSENVGIPQFSMLSALLSLGWLRSAWVLSNFVPTRKEAEEIYSKKES